MWRAAIRGSRQNFELFLRNRHVLGGLLVPAALPHQACRCSDPRSNGGALPSIAANGATNGAEGGLESQPSLLQHFC